MNILTHPAARRALATGVATCLLAGTAIGQTLPTQTPTPTPWPTSPSAPSPSSLSSSSLSAAVRPEPLSLDALVRTILTYNTELLSAERSRATAAAAVVSASALPNPRVEYSAGRQRAIATDASAGPMRGWGVSQLIENPALRRARIDAARAAELGTRQSVAVVRNTLVAEIRVRGYEYLLRQAEAAAAADALALLEQVQTRVNARVTSGEAPRYEAIKAESEIINARQVRDTAALMVEQAALTLNRLAAGHLPPSWTLSDSLSEVSPLPERQTLIDEALTRNPELLALQADIDRAGANVAGARASRWPGVEVRYGQSRDPDVRQGTLSVGVQIPLFDQRNGPIAEASSEQERFRGRHEGRQFELRQQILQATQMLEIARLKVSALGTGAIRDAEAALRVAEAAYRYGERGILDVLDAQRVLRAVRADLLAARFQMQAARIDIELLAGRYAGEANPN